MNPKEHEHGNRGHIVKQRRCDRCGKQSADVQARSWCPVCTPGTPLCDECDTHHRKETNNGI